MKKVEIYDGCFSRHITIDNIDFNEYNKEELINLIKIKLKDENFLREVFEIYIQNFSIDEEYGDRGICDQCGHWCSSQTYFF